MRIPSGTASAVIPKSVLFFVQLKTSKVKPKINEITLRALK